MAKILVVEDSPDQALMITSLLEAHGFDTETVRDGDKALEAIKNALPDVVVTDLIMPGLNGMQLVEAVRKDYPALPVILVTAYGSGDIAAKALQQGAASYVPKRRLRDQLVSTVESTHALALAARARSRLLHSIVESEQRFVLTSDPTLVPPLVAYVQEGVSARVGEVDENEMMQVGVALQEALLNAVHHGNLEISSDLRDSVGDEFRELIRERQTLAPYESRRVRVRACLAGREFTCTITDEGPGFDVSTIPDPTDPANLMRVSGRGLFLMKTFMDAVEFNAVGNEVTMVKHLSVS